MNPETTSRVTTVTPFSKALAAILFILMPFVGVYIGYTFAPEKVVEVERDIESKVLVKQTQESDGFSEKQRYYISRPVWLIEYNGFPGDFVLTDTNERVELVNVSESYKNSQGPDTQKLALLSFEYGNLENLFFIVGVPESDACCKMVKYDVKTNSFTEIEEYHGPLASVVSNNFLVTGSEDRKITVYDMANHMNIVDSVTLASEQTLVRNECTMIPLPYAPHDIIVSESGLRVFYTVYEDLPHQNCIETRPFVETRELELNHY